MEEEPRPLAVCDANVLIDYFGVDEDLIRELVAFWGHVFVPDVVLNEVKGTTRARAEELGLTVLETPFVLLECKPLSFQDRSCLHFVIENNWVCIANDTRLRKECEARGVRVVWGMEMLALLVENGQVTRKRALDCGEKIHNINPAITADVLGQFRKRLKKPKETMTPRKVQSK